MLAWIYKWLPILFGCHCRDDRSFHWRGRKFPICARCTGELAGILIGAASAFWFLPSTVTCLFLMIPMVLDGFLQLKTAYESTNPRRFLTGLLFGYALLSLLVISSAAVYRLGFSVTAK